MRPRLIWGMLVICACLFAIARTTAMSTSRATSPSPFAAQPSGNPPAGTNVAGDGCVRAGVEAGCLNLTTKDKKNKYSLHFDAKNKPSTDTMIHFEGTTTDVDTCMQGTPVKVTKWNTLKTKCPADSK